MSNGSHYAYPDATPMKGVSSNEPTVVNEKGGKQSKVNYAFHLIDKEALLSLAEVLAEGAEKYERDNWRKISSEEHYNHMMIHWMAYISGDKQDDHLGHFFCRAMMAYATAKQEGKINNG